MKRADSAGHRPALADQINDLENQLIRRRENVRARVTGIKQKMTEQWMTPGLLLAGAGIGVALEQSSHDKAWSLAALLNAANASLSLILAFKASDPA